MKSNAMRGVFRALIVIVFLCLEALNFRRIDSASHSASDTLRPFMIQTVFLGFLFIAIFILVNRLRRTK
jgi:hypothetical protein